MTQHQTKSILVFIMRHDNFWEGYTFLMFLQIYGTVIFSQTNRPVRHNVDELECYGLNFFIFLLEINKMSVSSYTISEWRIKSQVCVICDGAAVYTIWIASSGYKMFDVGVSVCWYTTRTYCWENIRDIDSQSVPRIQTICCWNGGTKSTQCNSSSFCGR